MLLNRVWRPFLYEDPYYGPRIETGLKLLILRSILNYLITVAGVYIIYNSTNNIHIGTNDTNTNTISTISFGTHYTMIIIRSPQNNKVIVKAPTLNPQSTPYSNPYIDPFKRNPLKGTLDTS